MSESKHAAQNSRSYTYWKESETQLLLRLIKENRNDNCIDWKKIQPQFPNRTMN